MLLLHLCICFFFFKQKTAYEMRISDWSSDVCSSDLVEPRLRRRRRQQRRMGAGDGRKAALADRKGDRVGRCVDLRDKLNVHALKIGRASCRERVCQYV